MDSLILRRYWPLALVATLFAIYGWALVWATGSGHDGAIGPRFNTLGADWVIFLAAAGQSSAPIRKNGQLFCGAMFRKAQAIAANCTSWLSAKDHATGSAANGRTSSRKAGG